MTNAPALLLHEERCRANIARMKAKADRLGLALRPHFKTHQSAEVGEWFREAGIDRITVSSVAMGHYFARHGWRDITVAFPFNLWEAPALEALAAQAKVQAVVESPEALEALGTRVGRALGVWIKVDLGYGRTGLDARRPEPIARLLDQARQGPHEALGFLAHAGNSYQARGHAGIRAVHEASIARAYELIEALGPKAEGLAWSLGDTPTCSAMDNFGPAAELRPGNFAFYDWMQTLIGSCRAEDVAVGMDCPVVAVHPERGEAVLYGGAVHFSKDFVLDEDGRPVYGQLASWDGGTAWGQPVPGAVLTRLSQEHGILRLPPGHSVAVGDRVLILPAHSCLTADAMQGYRLAGTGKRIGMMLKGELA